jgi:hypothetical protein
VTRPIVEAALSRAKVGRKQRLEYSFPLALSRGETLAIIRPPTTH